MIDLLANLSFPPEAVEHDGIALGFGVRHFQRYKRVGT